MRLEDVTTEVLERWRATSTSSNRTVAKHLVILHGIFRRAMKVWGLPSNPAATVERPRYRVSNDLEALLSRGGVGTRPARPALRGRGDCIWRRRSPACGWGSCWLCSGVT